jgi:hypothetical protein
MATKWQHRAPGSTSSVPSKSRCHNARVNRFELSIKDSVRASPAPRIYKAHLDKRATRRWRSVVCGAECGKRFGSPQAGRDGIGGIYPDATYLRDGDVWRQAQRPQAYRIRVKYGTTEPAFPRASEVIRLPAKVVCSKCGALNDLDPEALQS